MRSRSGYRTAIPSITSNKAQTKQVSFKDGVNTYKANDDLKPTELAAAIDARMVRIGRYKTRRGADRYSVPLGEAVNVQNASTTGASVVTISGTRAVAQRLTVASTARLTKVEVNIRSTSTSSGTVLVEVRKDNSGAPGDLIARSSIRSADITSSLAYKACYFISAPTLTVSDVVWVVVKGQSQTAGSYEVATTTAATTALLSVDTGVTWSSTVYSANVKLYTSTDGAVKGVTRAYRPNTQKVTVMFAGDSAYTVDESTGATTSIKSGMSSSATHYRARMVQDAIYWVNGFDKPYKYDFTTVTQVTASPYVPSLIEEHKGMLFFVDAADKTRLYYTNFAEYGVFTSTDFIYVPAPKSYDSLTALAKLNGVLFIFANRNKFQLLGSDNATFSLDESPSQRGTFTQESVVYDANFIYHADEEGVHKFNGTDDRNLAEVFLEDYLAIPDKSTIQLEVFNNRLYIFHAQAGSADNNRCFVYNLLLEKYEGLDTNTYIGRTFSRYAQDNVFIQGSNRVAALYYGELETNDYHNLGDQLQFELRTAYNHFDTTGQRKRIPKWRPVFASAGADYNVEVGYAIDLQTNATWQNIALGGSGVRFNTGVTFNSGAVFGGVGTIEPTSLTIPGSFKRVQRRYRHIAAREPVEFDSEQLTIEAQRLI
ncbi:MAG: hypothetical protein LC803_09330 [Acidobacteria bacterium]|nr:hypothetical protein [Acidobacteriota bacterium]